MALYDIYFKNYLNENGEEVTAETLLYSVPIANPELALIDPVVKCDMGKTGSFEFSIEPSHPWYNSWQQMKTIARVVYDGDTIFRGRALTIDNTLIGTKKLHFEGDMAFLLDSFQPGTKEEERSEITILAYLQQIINTHNAQMRESGETDKVFTLGEVPGQYSNAIVDSQKVKPDATKKYGSNSWEQTMNALEALQKDFGGYYRTRYVNGIVYLDWLDCWYNNTVHSQRIQIAENLIELQSSAEVDNIFTALIPIGSAKGNPVYVEGYNESYHGANKRILVPQIVEWYNAQGKSSELNRGYHTAADYSAAVNKYGVIYKIQKFDNADTQEKLWNYACDFILNNYAGGLTSFSVSAVDMHHLDGTVAKYLCGDRIPVIYPDLDGRKNNVTPMIQKTLTATSIGYRLHNPEKNEYTLGIPNSIIQKKYGTAAKSGGGGGGGSGKNANDEIEDDLEKAGFRDDLEGLDRLAWEAIINAKYNNEEYQELLASDPQLKYAPVALKSSHFIIKEAFEAEDETDMKYWEQYNSIMLGSGKFTINQPPVGPVADKFLQTGDATSSLIYDATMQSLELKMKYKDTLLGMDLPTAVQLKADYNSADMLFKRMVDQKEKVAAKIEGVTGTVSNIVTKLGLDGNGEQTTMLMNGLESMIKLFNPSSFATDPSNPLETIQMNGSSGVGRVGKDNNGGWEVTLNNTITYTDIDGNPQTIKGAVSAKDISIPEIGSFKTQFAVVDNLVAQKATIVQLNATKAEIEEVVATKLTATEFTGDNIVGKITSSHTLVAGTIQANNVQTNNFQLGGYPLDWDSIVMHVYATPGDNGQITLYYNKLTDRAHEIVSFETAASVTLDGNWSGQTYTATASNGESVDTTISWGWNEGALEITDENDTLLISRPFTNESGTGAGTGGTVTTISSFDSSHLAYGKVLNGQYTVHRFRIDASGEYTAGHTQGVTDGVASVGVTSAWSGNTVTVTPKANSQEPNASFEITIYAGSSSLDPGTSTTVEARVNGTKRASMTIAAKAAPAQRTISSLSAIALANTDNGTAISKTTTATFSDGNTQSVSISINTSAVYLAGRAAGWKLAADSSGRSGDTVKYPKSTYNTFGSSKASLTGSGFSYRYTPSSASYDSGGSNQVGYTVYQDYTASSFTVLAYDSHAVGWTDA